MTTITLLIGLTTLAVALLYLSLPNQRWLARPLPARYRPLVLVAQGVPLLGWLLSVPPLTAVLAWLVVVMLALGLLPALFLLWWRAD
ncbi:hypothetical protein [Oceanobacter sp. 4_MG-2023]|uniref:hypothetical protein n=1 Tax=Oceanobacter sp. 4_MG-2023 TaxID=3062623 RepID=UPI002736D63F|nr:hypothetical protein [Oceanobacter sp. 4_MG-2023]MDP2547623.1 hypothetical protein [Oceanobacter sp. 4_MG-2023]